MRSRGSQIALLHVISDRLHHANRADNVYAPMPLATSPAHRADHLPASCAGYGIILPMAASLHQADFAVPSVVGSISCVPGRPTAVSPHGQQKQPLTIAPN